MVHGLSLWLLNQFCGSWLTCVAHESILWCMAHLCGPWLNFATVGIPFSFGRKIVWIREAENIYVPDIKHTIGITIFYDHFCLSQGETKTKMRKLQRRPKSPGIMMNFRKFLIHSLLVKK